ncbi:hypothetical protein BB560_001569 [Smittium megazygosporum]|uniref:TRIP4/RQT4 C2HC5-type zinc finger domain-containing protein n=1 Tax=Smittium megazygosporum TaxID=133381 RepID=A0A2T9ZH87_9FUNG|nr:hypothetical protein BB560_001569 [Smittium megazygosporum]
MQLAEFKSSAVEKLSSFLSVSKQESAALTEKLLKVSSAEELETELLDILGFEESALEIVSFFISNYSLWTKPATQKVDPEPNNHNKKEFKNQKKNSYATASNKKEDLSLGKATSTKNNNLSTRSEKDISNEKPRIVGYRKELSNPVYFQGSKNGKNKTSDSEPVMQNPASLAVSSKIMAEILPESESFKLNESKNLEDSKLSKSTSSSSKLAPNSQNSSTAVSKTKKNNKPSPKVKYQRQICGCQALSHPLFTNCLNCGRTICVIEGSGPCFGCGAKVESRRQQAVDQIKKLLVLDDSIDKNTESVAEKVYDLIYIKPDLNKTGTSKKVKGHTSRKTEDKSHASRYSSKLGGTVYSDTKEWLPANKVHQIQSQNNNSKTASSNSNFIKKSYLEKDEVSKRLVFIEEKLRTMGITSDTVISEIKKSFEANNTLNRLLELDLISFQTQKIIDEKADFDIDAVNQWMTSQEKVAMEKAIRQHKENLEQAERNKTSSIRVLRLDIEKKTISFEREKEKELPKLTDLINQFTINEEAEIQPKFEESKTAKRRPIKFNRPEIVLPGEMTKKSTPQNNKKASKPFSKENKASRGRAKEVTQNVKKSNTFSNDFTKIINVSLQDTQN